jgi:glutamate--cysteine ligase
MMFRTCTVQANLDFASEADMVAKFRVSLALQPIATALFANSPFVEGKPSGLPLQPRPRLDRHRSRPHRHAGFRVRGRLRLRDLRPLRARRADVFRQARRPLYRRRRPVVRAFMDGKLPLLPGERPTIKDWGDHTQHHLPRGAAEATYLEMRGADTGPPWSRLCALAALWMGCSTIPPPWPRPGTSASTGRSRTAAPARRFARLALKAEVAGRSVQDVAIDMLAIAGRA